MQLRLKTLSEIDFVTSLLARWRRQKAEVRWRIGPMREQLAPVVSVPSQARRLHCDRSVQEVCVAQVITDSQQFRVSVAFVDKKGNPAPVENIVFGVSDAALLSITADPSDPNAATVAAVGPLGTGQVSVQADSLVGDGEAVIAGALDVEVIAGQALTAVFSTGTPDEQP